MTETGRLGQAAIGSSFPVGLQMSAPAQMSCRIAVRTHQHRRPQEETASVSDLFLCRPVIGKRCNTNLCRNLVGITTRPPNVIGWRSLRPTRLRAAVISRTAITGGRLPHLLMRQMKLKNIQKVSRPSQLAASHATSNHDCNVRYWHKADMGCALQMSAFGGKADMPFCTANVRF